MYVSRNPLVFRFTSRLIGKRKPIYSKYLVFLTLLPPKQSKRAPLLLAWTIKHNVLCTCICISGTNLGFNLKYFLKEDSNFESL